MKKQLPLVKSVIILFMISLISPTNAQNLVQPRPVSPTAKVKQEIGLSTVALKYSRPKVTLRGSDRTDAIWGQQILYSTKKTADKEANEVVWRAGANENTIIYFSDDAKIEGKEIKAGKYGLHMLIYEGNKATIIFSSNTSSWGSFHYTKDEDVLRVDVDMIDIPKTEVLTYEFVDYGRDYTVLALSWEKKRIPMKIEFAVDDLIIADYEEQLRGSIGFGWQAYVAAANYCLQNDTHLDKANEWIDISISRNKNFQNMTVKAGLLDKQGKKEEADKMLDEAVAGANNNQLNNLGYQMINKGRMDKAIEYFTLNVKRNPKDPNVYDSLGEAYKMNGDNKNAEKYLKKSLSLDPPPNVKANSLRLLKEMGVEYES